MDRGELEDRPEQIRTFVGIPVPEGHRAALEPQLAAWAEAAPAFRWVAAENLHLTLRFLGGVQAAVAEALARELAELAAPAFELQLGGLGSFGRGRRVRVIFLRLEKGEPEAAVLARRVEEACRSLRLPPEERPFNAHLTLARARDRFGAPLPELPSPPELPGWRAAELIVYRSRLGRQGARYEAVHSFPLV
ncbi:MAG TPA: RNA 2',3'-cyclic phosphodiesterase [Candidatus Acidoferrales bacterium]|nr:RNA 2',3'-cyclic phosphodiesterase [Candidatus Acidoferrales bacterium]